MLSKQTKQKIYWRLLLPLFFCSLIAFVDRVNIAYAALTMNKDMDFSAEVFGFGAGIFFLGYVLFEIPGALIAERFSPRFWLSRIMVTWGLFSVLLAFIRNETDFYILRFLLGAAEASFYPVIYASIIPRWFAPNERPKALALFLTSMQLSSMIGSPLAGLLLGISIAGLHGWQILFILEAIPAILIGFCLYFIIADRPDQVSWLSNEEKEYLTKQSEAEVAHKNSIKAYRVIEALKDWEVIKLCLLYFFWITGFWGFNFWMPTILKSVSGFSTVSVGLLVIIPYSFALIAMLYVGYSSSKTNEKVKHAIIPLFIGIIGLAFGALNTDHILISFICLNLMAIGVFAPFGVFWSFPTTFLSGPAAAGAIGLINSSGNLGGFMGPYIIGFIKQATGSFSLSLAYLACSLLVSIFFITRLRRSTEKIELTVASSVSHS